MMRADFELVPTIEEYCRTFGERSKLKVAFDKEGAPPPLSNDAQLTIFRVLQEALSNARKHASPKELAVRFTAEPGLVSISISDDGVGFDAHAPRRGHYGLSTMRERASKIGAEVEIASSPGQGTRIVLRIPTASASARLAR